MHKDTFFRISYFLYGEIVDSYLKINFQRTALSLVFIFKNKNRVM